MQTDRRMMRAITIASLLGAGVVHAQPAPAPAPAPAPSGDKVDAKALLASGLKLYAAKDYLGALAVFKDAYSRFPSAKILLNIGTTLKALNRHAEAANTYQRYLDASDAEATKKPEVEKVLAELDTKLGIIEITVTPEDAEVQVGTDDWITAREAARYRVSAGSLVVSARRADYSLAAKPIEVAAGSRTQVALELKLIPVLKATTTTTTTSTTSGTGVTAKAEPVEPPGKLGAFAFANVDVQFKGVAARVGASYAVIDRLQVEAAALMGGTFGAYAGARYAFTSGMFRPMLAAGAPIFVSNGARVGARGAGGLELAFTRHLSLVAELGVEHVFNPEPNFAATVVVPAIGAAGRL